MCDPKNFYKAQLILTAKASRTTNSKVDCLLPPKLNTVVRPDKPKVQEANRCTDASEHSLASEKHGLLVNHHLKKISRDPAEWKEPTLKELQEQGAIGGPKTLGYPWSS